MKKYLIFFCSVLVTGRCTASIDVMHLPTLTEHVSDFTSGAVTSGQLSELRSIASAYETDTTHQLVTVLIPDRQGHELFDIGMKIFRDNGIGQKDKDNGLLLLIATNEKKIRIVVGYGLESVVPDALAREMIETDIRPRVNSGDIYQGVKHFYERAIGAIGTGEIVATPTVALPDDDTRFYFLVLGVLAGIVRTIRGTAKNQSKEMIGRTYKSGGLAMIGSLLMSVIGTFAFLFLGYTLGYLIGVVVRAIINTPTGGGGSDRSSDSSSRSSSDSSSDRSSSSSSSSSSGFSGGGGSSGGGGAGD